MKQGGRLAGIRRCVGFSLILASCLLGAPVSSWSQTPKSDTGTPQKQKAPAPKVRYDADDLPRAVVELRESLLAAVEAGLIEELRHALDLSHIKPDTGAPPNTDPIAHWKGTSGDTQGREVLAALSLVLDAGYVAVRRGTDIENNLLYVWPYFAEVALNQLTPRQEVELLRLVPAGVAREMKAKGKYTGWRVVIGADGTWHAFRAGE